MIDDEEEEEDDAARLWCALASIAGGFTLAMLAHWLLFGW